MNVLFVLQIQSNWGCKNNYAHFGNTLAVIALCCLGMLVTGRNDIMRATCPFPQDSACTTVVMDGKTIFFIIDDIVFSVTKIQIFRSLLN